MKPPVASACVPTHHDLDSGLCPKANPESSKMGERSWTRESPARFSTKPETKFLGSYLMRAAAIPSATNVAYCCFGRLLLLVRHVETLLGILDPVKCLLAQGL